MINTIRVYTNKTQTTVTCAVFSDTISADYKARAIEAVTRAGDTLHKIEVEEWYSETKIKSCKTVLSLAA